MEAGDKGDSLYLKTTIRIIAEADATRCFGPGLAALLMGVEKNGSLRAAAIEMGMSYSKAWRIIHNAEKKLNFTLLESTTGGVSGGGASLSPEGDKLLNDYTELVNEVETYAKLLYKSKLGWLSEEKY